MKHYAEKTDKQRICVSRQYLRKYAVFA